MAVLWQWSVAALVAYLLGSFPSGVVMSKMLGAPDVRYHGSHNIGGTNTMRLMGPTAGAAVVMLDGLKGLLAWGATYIIMEGNMWALAVAGTMAVTGHCWPIYTKFHGGLGLATAGGLFLVVSPLTIPIFLLFWVIFFAGIYRERYSPRSVMFSLIISVTLSIYLLSLPMSVALLLISVAIISGVRHIPEWNRVV